MASASVCTACRQALRQQVYQFRQAQPPYKSQLQVSTVLNPPRPFTTSLRLTVAQVSAKQKEAAPRPYAPSLQSAIIASESPQGVNSTTKPHPQPDGKPTATFAERPSRTIAKELRKRAGGITETYVAYGVCEKLVKECARQADYTIPQIREKDAEVPKTKDAEDLGVGTGWWYESKHPPLPIHQTSLSMKGVCTVYSM